MRARERERERERERVWAERGKLGLFSTELVFYPNSDRGIFFPTLRLFFPSG